MGHASVKVYGEAYGGKMQGCGARYGKDLRFIAFEVQIGEKWLNVPAAAAIVESLGLEFVHYSKVSTDLAVLDAERDAPSEQSRRLGMGEHRREGVVLRPLVEFLDEWGHRVMCKHKHAAESETATPRPVVDPSKLTVLSDANAIALDWVTENRLGHVLGKLELNGVVFDIKRMREVIAAMEADVLREGAGEIVDSKEVRGALGKRTAELFKAHLAKKAAQ